jgi:hypothetical protein
MPPVDRRRYGRAHRAARAAYIALYQPGVTPCALCGKPMLGSPQLLDLAHDESGWTYIGWRTGDATEAGARPRRTGSVLVL